MKNEGINVSFDKFNEMTEAYSSQSIAENGTATAVYYLNNLIVITGITRLYEGECIWDSVRGYQVVPEILYKGDLLPLEYGKHWDDVDKGNRAGAYTGMRIFIGNKPHVFIGTELTFKQTEQGKQISIF